METMEAILELRKKLNISQDEFARKLSVTRQAVSRWENGDTIPNIDTLKLIAETFEVSVDYLLGHTVGQCQSCGLVLERTVIKEQSAMAANQRNTALFVISMENSLRILLWRK